MKVKVHFLLGIVLCSSLLMLGGCTSPGKNMIPQGGSMTMSQIYQDETGNGSIGTNNANAAAANNQSNIRARLQNVSQINDSAYVSMGADKVNSEFKRLPDPEVPIYIYPHFVRLNGQSYPKPGMTTEFFLYKRNHFALPNEIY